MNERLARVEKEDPLEMHNLIADPAHRDQVRTMRKRLFELNAETGGEPEVRYTIKEGHRLHFRRSDGTDQAKFPESIFRDPNPDDIEDYKE